MSSTTQPPAPAAHFPRLSPAHPTPSLAQLRRPTHTLPAAALTTYPSDRSPSSSSRSAASAPAWLPTPPGGPCARSVTPPLAPPPSSPPSLLPSSPPASGRLARCFAFRWHPFAIDPAVDYSNEPTTLVTFTLRAVGAETELMLVESGFDALPAARRGDAFRANDGGWTAQMDLITKYVASHAA